MLGIWQKILPLCDTFGKYKYLNRVGLSHVQSLTSTVLSCNNFFPYQLQETQLFVIIYIYFSEIQF